VVKYYGAILGNIQEIIRPEFRLARIELIEQARMREGAFRRAVAVRTPD
jgi:hypothetical protein